LAIDVGQQYWEELAYWEKAVRLQGPRTRESVRECFRAMEGSSEERLAGLVRVRIEAHFLFTAVRNVLRYSEGLEKLTGNANIRAAVKRFKADAGRAKDFRDMLEHMDAYIQGKGHVKIAFPEMAEVDISESGDAAFAVAGRPIATTAEATGAALELARTMAEIRRKEDSAAT
jgi:hypothetical protein